MDIIEMEGKSLTIRFQLNRINPSGGVFLKKGGTLSCELFPTKPH
jgi:hypothetical protein